MNLLPFAETTARQYLRRYGREPGRDQTIERLDFGGHAVYTPDEFAQLEAPPPISLLREVWTYRELFA